MPTYQYRCLDCSNELEVVQKFTDDPLTECPECDGTLRKVYSAVGVVFKGSGFYATDNRSKRTDKATSSSETKESGSTDKIAAAKSSSGEKKAHEKKSGGESKAAKPAAGSPAA